MRERVVSIPSFQLSKRKAWEQNADGQQNSSTPRTGCTMSRTSNSNIVTEWLRSLHLGHYAESFIDNGYDDLEICKQVGDPDLDAIGVFNQAHRNTLLQSVRNLREEGAASVYFTLEETLTSHDECVCDSASVRSINQTSFQWDLDRDRFAGFHIPPSPATSLGNREDVKLYYDDYEEGKTELVKIPRLQLKMLLRGKLDEDGIRLSCQPYSNKVGAFILIDSYACFLIKHTSIFS